jgi:hypothetical protein
MGHTVAVPIRVSAQRIAAMTSFKIRLKSAMMAQQTIMVFTMAAVRTAPERFTAATE